MELPPLPKQHKKKEADFGLVFRKWWDIYKPKGTFELKHTRGKNYFRLSELHEEQKTVGKLIQGEGILLRTATGTIGLPDYIGLKEFPQVYVVIKYPKNWYIILLDVLLKETTPSLSNDRARELALFT